MHTTTRICISAKNSWRTRWKIRDVGTLCSCSQNYRLGSLRFRDRGISGDLETPRMRANVSLLIPRRHLLRSLSRSAGYKSARIRDGVLRLLSFLVPMHKRMHRGRNASVAQGGIDIRIRHFLQISVFALNVFGRERMLAMLGIFKHLLKFFAQTR